MRSGISTFLNVIDGLLLIAAAWLCWAGVSWALQPGLFLVLDELGNPTRFIHGVDWAQVTLLPSTLYNDRPVGLVLERWLYEAFGFGYEGQARWYLLLHAMNLALGYGLFRKLGVSRPLTFASLGLFGVLNTTAQTATYIGAIFDVAALFFVLAGTLLFLMEAWWANIAATALYVLALRTKEFTIVLPALWALLAWMKDPKWREGAKRLAGPFAVGSLFALKYAMLMPQFLQAATADNPYRMRVELPVIWDSVVYYVKLISTMDDHPGGGGVIGAGLAILVLAGVALKNARVLFALAAAGLLLLPLTMLPGIRAPYYVYAPQMFMLLAIALAVEDVTGRVPGSTWVRVALAIGVLGSGAALRQSAYNTDRLAFLLNMRRDSAKAAPDAYKLLPLVRKGARVYVNSAGVAPWVLVGGPCAFFQLLEEEHDITCVWGQPPKTDVELLAQGFTMVFDYDAQHHITARALSAGAERGTAGSVDPNPASRR